MVCAKDEKKCVMAMCDLAKRQEREGRGFHRRRNKTKRKELDVDGYRFDCTDSGNTSKCRESPSKNPGKVRSEVSCALT